MESFATVEDYEARWGDVEDTDQLGVLLSDASAFLAAQPGLTILGPDDAGYDLQQANLTRVTCAIVHRALSAGDWAGLSSVSQTAGSYSASVSPSNPTEDFYLTKADKQALGMAGSRVSTVRPAIHDGRGEPIW